MRYPRPHRFTSIALACILIILSKTGARSAGAAARWEVLVLDRTGISNHYSWSTIWSDGKRFRRLAQPIVSRCGRLMSLKVKSFREESSCRQGKYPFFYEVDLLTAQPLGGGEPQVLLGQNALNSAKDIMKEHLSTCEGMKPLPFAPDTTPSFERFKISLLSLYDQILGVEQRSESFGYGKPNPMSLTDWGSFQLDQTKMRKLGLKALPPEVEQEARTQVSRLTAVQREPYSPIDFDHFVMVPRHGGLTVEFGIPPVQDSPEDKLLRLTIERAGGLTNQNQDAGLAFRTHHHGLVHWDKVDFYTIAPDQSAVVYADKDKLYWQPVTGQPKLIGQVQEVLGWQWFNASLLGTGQRRALSADQL